MARATTNQVVTADELRAIQDATMTEKELQSQVLALARVYGWRTYHTFDSRHSAAGFPDVVMVRGERLIFAELKTVRGKLSGAQEAWLDELGGYPGREAYCWRPGALSSGEIERRLA